MGSATSALAALCPFRFTGDLPGGSGFAVADGLDFLAGVEAPLAQAGAAGLEVFPVGAALQRLLPERKALALRGPDRIDVAASRCKEDAITIGTLQQADAPGDASTELALDVTRRHLQELGDLLDSLPVHPDVSGLPRAAAPTASAAETQAACVPRDGRAVPVLFWCCHGAASVEGVCAGNAAFSGLGTPLRIYAGGGLAAMRGFQQEQADPRLHGLRLTPYRRRPAQPSLSPSPTP